MKRLAALTLALFLMMSAALSEGVREAIELTMDGQSMRLNFDAAPEFSVVAEGKAQASFYTYSEDATRLYELTMMFPADVQSGDVIDTAYARSHSPDYSVVAIITRGTNATYYFAGVMNGAAIPDESAFAITFDDVTWSDSGATYTGHLTARLQQMDLGGRPGGQVMTIEGAPFSFTMPSVNQRTPEPIDDYNPFDAEPDRPAVTPAPTDRDLVRV